MKTLSIRQPWAWAILQSGKDIENRNWPTSVRGRILIHVGKTYDNIGHSWLEDAHGLVVPQWLKKNLGGIVGSVEIIDCVKGSQSKWFFGKFGFVLRDPITLPFMPLQGQLGFWNADYRRVDNQV
jgi:hypothetical protein